MRATRLCSRNHQEEMKGYVHCTDTAQKLQAHPALTLPSLGEPTHMPTSR